MLLVFHSLEEGCRSAGCVWSGLATRKEIVAQMKEAFAPSAWTPVFSVLLCISKASRFFPPCSLQERGSSLPQDWPSQAWHQVSRVGLASSQQACCWVTETADLSRGNCPGRIETLKLFLVEQIKKRRLVSELLLFQATFLFLWTGKASEPLFHFFHSLLPFTKLSWTVWKL